MNDKKGTMQNISFSVGNLDLYDYVEKLASDRHGGMFSSAVMECIRTHKEGSDKLGLILAIVRDIGDRIDNLQVTGISPEQKEEIKKQVGFNLSGNLFE